MASNCWWRVFSQFMKKLYNNMREQMVQDNKYSSIQWSLRLFFSVLCQICPTLYTKISDSPKLQSADQFWPRHNFLTRAPALRRRGLPTLATLTCYAGVQACCWGVCWFAPFHRLLPSSGALLSLCLSTGWASAPSPDTIHTRTWIFSDVKFKLLLLL